MLRINKTKIYKFDVEAPSASPVAGHQILIKPMDDKKFMGFFYSISETVISKLKASWCKKLGLDSSYSTNLSCKMLGLI